MEGLILLAGLIVGVVLAGLKRERLAATPGPLMTLAVVTAGAWYLFA